MLTKKRWLLIVLALLMMIASACDSDKDKDEDKDKTEDGSNAEVTEVASPVASDKPVIKLLTLPWEGALANVEVARYILENEMGYPVEVVTGTSGGQWESIASGEAHVSFEVWPSGHQEAIKSHILDEQLVIQGTNLGVEGRVGWFIPAYVARAHPELLTWEGFLDPENGKLFASEETGDLGRFFVADPTWGSYDADIIKNRELQLEVVKGEKEADLYAMLEENYPDENPIVFYFWSPHWLFNQYDLMEVELPPYSEECYELQAEGGIDCAYPVEVLFKIYWPGLPEYAPDVYQFFENFQYTNIDQIGMMADMQLNGKTAEEAALTWIESHEEVWREWIPASE